MIQTKNKKGEWVDCTKEGLFIGSTWKELIDEGWLFAYQDKDLSIVMTRKGYINNFRCVE